MKDKGTPPVATIDFELLTAIVHEVKGPYNGLLGFSDLLTAEYNDVTEEKRFEYIQVLNQLANKSFLQLQTFVSWIKLISNNSTLFPSGFHFPDSISQAVTYNKNEIRAKQITMHTDSDVDHFRGDYMQLSLVIGNLLQAAIRVAPDGSAISIEAKQEDKQVLLTQKAALGSNTEEELIRWLVNMAELQDQSGYTERTFGLWCSKKIIEAHNGKIERSWINDAGQWEVRCSIPVVNP